MKENPIESILVKLFEGQSSPEENQIIKKWVSSSDENRECYKEYSKLWEKLQDTIINGEIDVEGSLDYTKKQIPEFQKRKFPWMLYLRKAAAVFLLSLILSFIAVYMMKQSTDNYTNPVCQEVKAAYGTQTKVTLSDGTNVWLNSGSSLSFPLFFSNMKMREVTLIGEGYFEVSKDQRHPFIVHTPKLEVKVLGTFFNINAYKNKNYVEVALLEGKVNILTNNRNGKGSSVILNPCEVAEYEINSGKMSCRKVKDMYRYTAWKDGKIMFVNDSIEKLADCLENWYNVNIQIDDCQLKKYHFTGTFTSESLDQILKYLSLSTPLKYKFLDISKTKNGNLEKQKIILYSK